MKDLRFTIIWGTNIFSELTLEHSPDGWDDNSLTVERSSTYYGIFRSYTIKLKFVKDGAELLRDIFYNGGNTFANLGNPPGVDSFILIEKLDKMSLTYEQVFTGSFDFGSYNDYQNYVEITIVDTGLTNLIKANQDNEYTVEFLTGNSFIHPVYYITKRVEFIYFSRLLELIFDRVTNGLYTQGKYGLDMTALTTLESSNLFRYVLTNHAALKTYRMTNAKTTFKDLMRTLFTLCKITASIEKVGGLDTLVLYQIGSVFPADVIISTDNVTNFKLSVATDYFYNKVIAGHLTQDYGDATEDSSREFNVETEFRITNLPVNNELNLVTAYRADTAGIKLAMSDLKNMPDEEELFICVIDRTFVVDHWDWKFESGFVKQNNVTTSTYNARISPRRIIEYHSDFLSSVRYGNDPGQIEFISTNLYNHLNYTRYQNTTIPPEPPDFVHEGSGYQLPASQLFHPLFIEFDTDLPVNLIKLLMAKPYGKIQFTYQGTVFSGFLISISIKLYGKCSGKIKLLSSADNDLTKLTH